MRPREFCGIPRATDPESAAFWERVDRAAIKVVQFARRMNAEGRRRRISAPPLNANDPA